MTDELKSLFYSFGDLSARKSMESYCYFIHKTGLSFTQIDSLRYIHHHGPVSMNRLSRYLGVSNAAVSQLAVRLIEAGLLSRHQAPGDGRSRLLCISPAGNALIEEIHRTNRLWLDPFLETLSDDDKAKIQPCMALLFAKLQDYIDTTLTKDQ